MSHTLRGVRSRVKGILQICLGRPLARPAIVPQEIDRSKQSEEEAADDFVYEPAKPPAIRQLRI